MTAPVLVTGATGFIGRRLVAALRGRGQAVRALVRDPARAATLLPAGADLTFASWDLDDGGSPEALAGGAALVHAAAHIPASQVDAGEAARCYQRNGLGALRLLEAAAAAGVSHAVHLSTGNAYLAQPRAVTEDDPLYPSARAPYYLTSKLAGEIYADHLRATGRLAVAILRPSAVYGPGMSGGVVAGFADKLRRGVVVTVTDGGRYQADLVYVDDVVDAIVAAHERRAVGAYNVGSGQATTMLTLARALATACGRGDDPAAIAVSGDVDGPPVVGFSALDVTKARRDLGYAPRALVAGLDGYLASLPPVS